MPKLSKADTILRESQVLKVQALRLETPSLTIADACQKVGIEERTYQRWVSKISVEALQAAVAKQRAEIARLIIEARVSGLEQVVNIATGKDEKARSADVILANKELKGMYDDLVRQIDAGSQTDKEGEAYLAGTPAWLQGPATVVVQTSDGTTVTVQTPTRPHVVEGSVVPDTQALPPALEAPDSPAEDPPADDHSPQSS